jgi:hypothetical protein
MYVSKKRTNLRGEELHQRLAGIFTGQKEDMETVEA